eukprot:3941249-Rhodomonas_salina.2
MSVVAAQSFGGFLLMRRKKNEAANQGDEDSALADAMKAVEGVDSERASIDAMDKVLVSHASTPLRAQGGVEAAPQADRAPQERAAPPPIPLCSGALSAAAYGRNAAVNGGNAVHRAAPPPVPLRSGALSAAVDGRDAAAYAHNAAIYAYITAIYGCIAAIHWSSADISGGQAKATARS